MRASLASLAGSYFVSLCHGCRAKQSDHDPGDLYMPRGRSTFTKRQKEQARQQRQREKAARRQQRKQAKPESSVDDMAELRAHAKEQAALFLVGSENDTDLAPARDAGTDRDSVEQ
jgi:hypothetical protein